MSEDLRHECGVAALYRLRPAAAGPPPADESSITGALTGLLLDLQNRGQLAAGISTYQPQRPQLIATFKDVGTVNEVFCLSRPAACRELLNAYAGCAGIGHTRYATSGADDARYAQPFERRDGRKWEWFSFAFNGQLANYGDLRERRMRQQGYHFSLDTDTEIVMQALAHGLRGDRRPALQRVMQKAARMFDGAYNVAFLDGLGRMFVARDPQGFRPMHWAVRDGLFGAASESVALTNAGFEDVRALAPGTMVLIDGGRLRLARFAPAAPPHRARAAAPHGVRRGLGWPLPAPHPHRAVHLHRI